MATQPIDAAVFSQVGEALYGPSWRAKLAAALNVAERTVRRWQDGDTAIPEGVRSDLAKLCRMHSRELEKLATKLER